MEPQVLVCQNRSCRKAGAAKVLQAFRQKASQEISVVACGCLGHCGSGPIALILPEEVWYDHVQPANVADIIQQHES
jgi:(2Fe-2S) ferredoxin